MNAPPVLDGGQPGVVRMAMLPVGGPERVPIDPELFRQGREPVLRLWIAEDAAEVEDQRLSIRHHVVRSSAGEEQVQD